MGGSVKYRFMRAKKYKFGINLLNRPYIALLVSIKIRFQPRKAYIIVKGRPLDSLAFFERRSTI